MGWSMVEWALCPVGGEHDPSPGLGRRAADSGPPTPLSHLRHPLPFEEPERQSRKQEQEEPEIREQEEWRERGEKWGRKGRRKTGRRRRRDGGGAVHLQIKFVIQASDGPTARD